MAPKKNSASASASASHVKRPMNAFMLYRQNTSPLFKKDGLTNHEISSLVGIKWQTLSDDEKAPYFLLADIKKQEHKDLYPDYKYTPAKKDATTKTNVPNAKKLPKMKNVVAGKSRKVVVTKRATTTLTILASQKPKVVETFSEESFLSTTMSILNNHFALEPLSDFFTEETLNDSHAYEDKSCDLSSPIDTTDGCLFFPDDEHTVLQPDLHQVKEVVVVAESTFSYLDYFNLCNEEFMSMELF